MYEYTVIFTIEAGRVAILVKEALSPKDAIRTAIEEADLRGYRYSAIEVVNVF